MKDLLKRYKRDLALRNFSVRTQKTYYRSLVHFLTHIKKAPQDTTNEDIKDYLYYLIRERRLSESTLRQARSSITYFFSYTLARPVEVENIPCQKKARKLPTVFSIDEVFKIIKCAANIKHKTMLMLTYSSGLRVGELVKLEIFDIRRDIMRIAVRQAKGSKDRYTILSSVCLTYLEYYWRVYRPVRWLFCGREKDTPLSIRAVQHAYNIAKHKAGITKPGGIHSLRHSFATHMLESGTGLFQLQKLLGHKHLSTTLVYAHITEENVIAKSPLDVYAEQFRNEQYNP